MVVVGGGGGGGGGGDFINFSQKEFFFLYSLPVYSYNGPFLTLKTRQRVYYIIAIHTQRTSSPCIWHMH